MQTLIHACDIAQTTSGFGVIAPLPWVYQQLLLGGIVHHIADVTCAQGTEVVAFQSDKRVTGIPARRLLRSRHRRKLLNLPNGLQTIAQILIASEAYARFVIFHLCDGARILTLHHIDTAFDLTV